MSREKLVWHNGITHHTSVFRYCIRHRVFQPKLIQIGVLQVVGTLTNSPFQQTLVTFFSVDICRIFSSFSHAADGNLGLSSGLPRSSRGGAIGVKNRPDFDQSRAIVILPGTWMLQERWIGCLLHSTGEAWVWQAWSQDLRWHCLEWVPPWWMFSVFVGCYALMMFRALSLEGRGGWGTISKTLWCGRETSCLRPWKCWCSLRRNPEKFWITHEYNEYTVI